MIHVKVIAVLRMRDDKGDRRQGRLRPAARPQLEHDRRRSTTCPQPLRDEISHFFSIYKQPEGKAVKVDGWYPREDAMAAIEAARERYLDSVSSGTESAGSSPGSERDARSS